jgi:predicted acyltransferase (DUF342 family)
VTGKLEADGDISTVKQSDVGGEVRTAQGSSGDISIEESNVVGPITADGNIPELKSVSKVGGPVEAGSVISAIKTSTVDGSVTAPDISQLEGVEINGNVTATDGANKDITVKSNNGESVICGNVVSTNGRVEKIKNSKVNGSVEAAQVGTLKGSNTEIGRSVRTTDQSADLEINGATVYGVVDAAGSIPEIKDSRVEGSVTAGGNVNVNESKVCTGPGTGLETKATVDTGKVKIKSSSTVSGPVDAAGPIEAVKGSTVKGNVDSDDKVKKIKDATVKGDVTADDKVGVIEQSTIKGSLTSGGEVEEVKQSTVEGSLTADGRVKVNDSDVCTDPNTGLDTTNGGPVKIESDSTVGGPISADGSIETIKDSTVKGDVVANGDVKLEGSTKIQGDVTSNGGTITEESNVTITGKTTENP